MATSNSVRTEARYLLLKTQGRKVSLDAWTEAELLGFDSLDGPTAHYIVDFMLKRPPDEAFLFLLKLRPKLGEKEIKGEGGKTIQDLVYKQIAALVPQCSSKVLLAQLEEVGRHNAWEELAKRTDWDVEALQEIGKKIGTGDIVASQHSEKVAKAIITRWGNAPDELSRICTILGPNEVIAREVFTFLVSTPTFPTVKLLEFCEAHPVALSRDEKAKFMHSRMADLQAIAAPGLILT